MASGNETTLSSVDAMRDEIIKGIAVGLGLILLVVAAGFGVGSCYAGGDYSVDTPEERAASVDEQESPSQPVMARQG